MIWPDHDCKQPEFCSFCDRVDEAMEQEYGPQNAELLFRGDETFYGRDGIQARSEPLLRLIPKPDQPSRPPIFKAVVNG